MPTAGSKALSGSVFINPHYGQLAYESKYCDLDGLEEYMQFAITDDSKPNINEALTLLKSAEAEIDSKEWGKYTQVDEYIDGRYEILTFQWQYVGFFAQIFYPRHTNIIRIITCHYNSGGVPSSDPTWIEVKEGPGTGSSFVVLRKAVLKEQLGNALLFYMNTPYPGPLRLRVTYEYGMNIDISLLKEYAGKLATKGGLEMRSAAEEINVNLEKGPWAALYKKHDERLKYLRDEVFPKKTRRVYVYPSIG